MGEKLLFNNIVDIHFYLKSLVRKQIRNSMYHFFLLLLFINEKVCLNYIPVIGILELEDNRTVTTGILEPILTTVKWL